MLPTPLTDLILRLTRLRRGTPWTSHATPEETTILLESATDEDLSLLTRCFPRCWDVLLRRLQHQLNLPAAPIDGAISRVQCLPPRPVPDPFSCPEGVDWAVERYRLLFPR